MWVYRLRNRAIEPATKDAHALMANVYEVGFFQPHGEWECLIWFHDQEESTARRWVNYLNGGGDVTDSP